MNKHILLFLMCASFMSGCGLFGGDRTFYSNIKIKLDKEKKNKRTVAVMFFFVKDLKKAEEILQKSPEELNDEYNKNTSTTPPKEIIVEGNKMDYYNIEKDGIVVGVTTFSFIDDETANDYKDLSFTFTQDESYQKVLVCYFPNFPGTKPEDYKVYEVSEDVTQLEIFCNAKKIDLKWQ